MKKKMVVSMLVIMVAIVATVGGTLAWFTDTATIEPNVFTAGTVEIEADESWIEGFEIENWNPGDCDEKIITVENVGSKGVLVRAKITESWTFKYVVDNNGDFVLAANGERTEINNPTAITPDDTEWEDVVDWDMDDSKWIFVDTWHTDADGYYYYDGMLEYQADPIIFISEVCLFGKEVGNKYQGATYTLAVVFEAIQASNNASGDQWAIDSEYGVGGTSSVDWENFEDPPVTIPAP